MVKVKEDLTGCIMSEHGVPDSRLIIVEQTEDYVATNGKHEARWLCKCNCGSEKNIIASSRRIKNGLVKSCGCLRNEKSGYRGRLQLKKENDFILNLNDEYGDYGIGYCSNTNREFYFDMDDYDKIKDYTWCEHKNSKKNYYALEAKDVSTNTVARMHWIIVGKNYDHADRNTFNNRKYNLRVATSQENTCNRNKFSNNTSGFIGVSWYEKSSLWSAYITKYGNRIHLGRYNDKEDAIKARLMAEKQYFGEFAPQRHLFEQYGI